MMLLLRTCYSGRVVTNLYVFSILQTRSAKSCFAAHLGRNELVEAFTGMEKW